MNLSREKKNDILILSVDEKEANLSKADHFKQMVIQEIDNGAIRLIISFKNVEYIDSSFLGALVGILKYLLPLGGKLILTDLNGDIDNLFEITRLNRVFSIKKDQTTAMLDL